MTSSSGSERPLLSRREFVCQAGLLAGAVTLGSGGAAALAAEGPLPVLPPAAPGGLPRRILGRTNVPLCMFTLGTAPCGSLPPPKIAELVNAALDEGVTAVDTSEMYQNSQEGVGLAWANAARMCSCPPRCLPTASRMRRNRWPSRSSC